LTKLATSTIES